MLKSCCSSWVKGWGKGLPGRKRGGTRVGEWVGKGKDAGVGKDDQKNE